MPAGHGGMRDGAEHAAVEVLRDGAALVCVSIRCHDGIAHQLLGERAGQPILLRQTLHLQSDSSVPQDTAALGCVWVPGQHTCAQSKQGWLKEEQLC